MTPGELAVYAEAYNERKENEHEQKREEIYTTALLISQFVWSKRPRSYEEVFGIKKKSKMPDAEMLRVVEALNAQFGGNDIRKGAK